MKFGSALFALTAVCLVRAAPNARRESNRNAAKAPKSTAANSADSPDTKVVGSAYFINNDSAGNYIVVHNIEKNGNISWAGVVSAGGEGHHGEDFGLFASDATYSNRIISVHQAKGLLATTNTKSNTVALFRIDRNDPSQLMMLGEPQPSWGDFPTSVAFSNDGDRLCVMNAGKAAGVLCYGVNDWGLAIQKESYRSITDLGYNQTTLPAGPINTVSQVIFTENDDALVVAIKGYVDPAPTRGGLIVWPIAENGFLAEKGIIASTPAPGGFPFSLTIMPGKNALFSADFSTGFDIFSFADGYENINNTANTAAYDILGEITTCWSAYSPTLDRYYISDPTTDMFTEIAVKDDLSSASVIANHTILTGGEPIDIAVATIDGVDYLYSLLTTESSVDVLRLDAPGQSTIVGISNFTQPVRDAGAAATINFYQGMAVYVKSD